MMHIPAGYIRNSNLLIRRVDLQLLQRHNLGDFTALLRTPGHRALNKRGLAAWRQRLALTLDDAGTHRRFFLKRYVRPPLGQQLRRILSGRPSTADIECSWLQSLQERNLPVPAVAAWGSRCVLGFESASLLLMTAVPGESLEQWLPEAVARKTWDKECKRRVSRVLADLICRLHGAGFFHRDLYLSHIFIQREAQEIGLYLIDLQRMIAPRWRRRRWVIKDLAALNYSTPRAAASRADRLRWFRSYLNSGKLGSRQKALARAVGRKSVRIARHSRKHGLG